VSNKCHLRNWGCQEESGPAQDTVFAYSLIGSPDLDDNGLLDIGDLLLFVEQWLETDCAMPQWCNGADIHRDGTVDMQDFAVIAEYWEYWALVPDVTGLSQEEAETVIVGAGLVVGSVSEEFSDSVPAGIVISQSPSAGVSIPQNSAVDLFVSKGLQPQTPFVTTWTHVLPPARRLRLPWPAKVNAVNRLGRRRRHRRHHSRPAHARLRG
jgi:hypothetical protein